VKIGRHGRKEKHDWLKKIAIHLPAGLAAAYGDDARHHW
jgi:hypothetical protein